MSRTTQAAVAGGHVADRSVQLPVYMCMFVVYSRCVSASSLSNIRISPQCLCEVVYIQSALLL